MQKHLSKTKQFKWKLIWSVHSSQSMTSVRCVWLSVSVCTLSDIYVGHTKKHALLLHKNNLKKKSWISKEGATTQSILYLSMSFKTIITFCMMVSKRHGTLHQIKKKNPNSLLWTSNMTYYYESRSHAKAAVLDHKKSSHISSIFFLNFGFCCKVKNMRTRGTSGWSAEPTTTYTESRAGCTVTIIQVHITSFRYLSLNLHVRHITYWLMITD